MSDILLTRCESLPNLSAMTTLGHISMSQLQRALAIREQIETLQNEMEQILAGETALPHAPKGRRKMSASAKARIGAAQKARWAKLKGNGAVGKPKRAMSAKARAAISAAAKERWKKAKAAGKSRL